MVCLGNACRKRIPASRMKRTSTIRSPTPLIASPKSTRGFPSSLRVKCVMSGLASTCSVFRNGFIIAAARGRIHDGNKTCPSIECGGAGRYLSSIYFPVCRIGSIWFDANGDRTSGVIERHSVAGLIVHGRERVGCRTGSVAGETLRTVLQMPTSRKGVRNESCKAPVGPFGRLVPDPFSRAERSKGQCLGPL